ncbi:MAG: hypothetical protein ACYDDO_13300 [Acidiferrobacterales bacterium]
MDLQADGRSRHSVLGPPLCRIFDNSVIEKLPPMAPSPPSARIMLDRISKMLVWSLRGLAPAR